tara:strand:- start:1725 stop:2297 length:573 start_codon:yes stop_codon:yes gene_type:complete
MKDLVSIYLGSRNLLFCLVIIMITSASSVRAQVFEVGSPKDFTSVSIQLDPLGSKEKKGLNAAIAFTAVDFGWLEYEIQSQFVINNEERVNGLTYLDLKLGVGVMMPINNRFVFTPGLHLGGVYRPGKVLYEHHDGWIGGLTYGVAGKVRYWIGNSKTIAIVVSSSLDKRPDIKGTPFRLDTRGGVEIRL